MPEKTLKEINRNDFWFLENLIESGDIPKTWGTVVKGYKEGGIIYINTDGVKIARSYKGMYFANPGAISHIENRRK